MEDWIVLKNADFTVGTMSTNKNEVLLAHEIKLTLLTLDGDLVKKIQKLMIDGKDTELMKLITKNMRKVRE